jgi:hypothetical protein
LVVAGAFLFAPFAQAGNCVGDLDGNNAVDVTDLLTLLAQWGPCEGCEADLDGNDVVDVTDLLELLGNWGPCLFDFGPPRENAEAEQIALESLGSGGPLIESDDLYNRVVQDLGAIRAFEPDLGPQIHSAAWVPNQMLVSVDLNQPHEQYDALNVYYQVIDVDHLFGDVYTLTFAGNINVPALAQVYSALPEVNYGEPNYIFGGQNFWTPSDLGGGLWEWDVDDGWHDCFDGCDCHRHYIFQVDDEAAVELTFYEEFGMPWCEF